jgi:sugar lactone lactonase YvrE
MQSLAPILRACIAAFAWAIVPSAALAVDVFVATLRSPSGSTEAGGQLYRVDPAKRTSTPVGRIMVDGTQPVGLTGMAFHPKTKVLYAITLGVNDAKRATLLTVDTNTAEARIIGRLSRPLTDISFDPSGRLFGWTADTGQLAVVDISSGKVSTIGAAGGSRGGGAFAIDREGNAFVATWSEPGTLDRVDLEAGAVAPGPAVSNLPDVSTLRSMAFSGHGELFATHSVRAGAQSSVLLRIDPRTGQAAPIGEIPEDSEAIAVLQEFADRPDMMSWLAHGAIAAMLFALAWIYFRRHRHTPRPG